MNTIKVTLPDGNTAELFADMKHKTQRAVEEITREFLTYPDGVGKLTISQGEDGSPVKAKSRTDEVEVTVDLDRINWTKVTESIIVNQVASWTFGEVTAEVLGEQSEVVYNFLKTTVNDLYQGTFPLPRSGVANSAKGWPWLLKFRKLFAYRRNYGKQC